MIEIVQAAAADAPHIETLLDDRFGAARRGRTAYRLREGASATGGLCLVARGDAALLGSVQCWPLSLRSAEGRRWPLVLLGPVAVARSHEGTGLGTRLMTAVLGLADAGSHSPQLLIGDAPFYGRFGFVAGAGERWHLPGPVERDRLLLRGDTSAMPVVGWLEPAVLAAA